MRLAVPVLFLAFTSAIGAAPALLAQTSQSSSSATLAPTPPMGWNSWNHFAEKVSDADVRAAADALVSTGMRDAGYIYVNIDDTWEGERDAQGVLHTNKKFPDMKALADYVHSKGLKLGIYSSPGPQTCAHYAGSYGHEDQDAALYASWGIDYLKYDSCSFGRIMDKEAGDNLQKRFAMMRAAYEKMHQALLKTGRPIVYSFCQYGWFSVWEWGPQAGANLWRTTGDISDNYDRMSLIGFQQAGLSKYAGPGHWNDPDMLEVGNGKMKPDEYRLHMTLWAMLAAPLLAGNDLSNMSAETRSILMNKDAIAIDQDRLGKQGDRVYAEGPLEIWTKPLSTGRAIAIFNRESPMTWKLPVSRVLGASGADSTAAPASAPTLHDSWTGTDYTPQDGNYTFTIPGHGVLLFLVK